MKRILIWGGFVVIVGLIVWGMILAANKAEKENSQIAKVDEVTSTDWVKGATSSPVTLVEYSDFQCPGCGAFFPIVERLISENPGKFLFVYRHFPLSQHLNAIPAARAAEAAGKQGKFWEMHSMIFSNQENWESSSDVSVIFTNYAKEFGLNMEKFKSDYESSDIMNKINNDLKSGLKAEVDSTPTFYLNGKKISPKNYEEFKKLIDDAYTTSANS